MNDFKNNYWDWAKAPILNNLIIFQFNYLIKN